MQAISVARDAARLARILVARNLASSMSIGYGIALAIMIGGVLLTSPKSLLVPAVWLYVGPIWAWTAFQVWLLWYLAVQLNSFRNVGFARAAYALIAANALAGCALFLVQGLVTPGLWSISFLVSAFVGVWLVVLLGLGVFAIPIEVKLPILFNAGYVGSTGFPYSNTAAIDSRPANNQDVRAFAWMLFSVLLFAGAVFAWLNLSGWLQMRRRWLGIYECPSGSSIASCLAPHQGDALAIVFATIVGSAALALWAHAARRHSYSITRRSASELLKADSRPPIVFLRSFPVDQVRYDRESPGVINTLCDLGRAPGNLDHLLLEEATKYGPVVAIGAPGTNAPILGVAREFAAADAWQDRVAEWISGARGIVLCFGNTPGVLWEIDEVRRQDAFHRTLTLVPPATDVSELWKKLDLPAVRVSAQERVVGVLGAGPKAVLLTARKLSHESYKLAIHAAFGR